ncbi:MAG: YggT family protein [Desulfobacteraceae bacterium]|nr:YggT family protein [Desulfobacteraceae bacterium]
MFIVGNFVFAIAQVINYILMFYMWVIVIRAVLSWVSPDPYNPIVRLIHNITEPVLYQIRKRVPIQTGGIDFSPILIILVIVFLQTFVVSSLVSIAGKLR